MIYLKLLAVLLITWSGFLYATDTVVAHDKAYFKFKKENVEVIYTQDNLPFAEHVVGMQTALHKHYEKFFGWKLDETLYVGLISTNKQIANGFSSQWSSNRQMNYVGGTQMIDYFSSTSWLNTLLYHETAHNYQGNMKGHNISRTLHSVFGNGSFIFPFFIVPNIMENSFMLEGNAVLNESWHGNGGRLYSGRFKAETLLQAKAGNIKASDVYNVKLAFPYTGNIWYIQGGFYNLYLAELYGMEKVNSYFKYYSKDFWWPQFTDESMKSAVGIDFETSLEQFSNEYAKMAEGMVLAEGEKIASSQFFYSLGNNKDEIFFIVHKDGVTKPELLIIDKATFGQKKIGDSWLSGKVIKADGIYYTQGSKNVSPIRIYQGLFDNEGFIKEGTASKMVQGYLSDLKEVYFDVASSYSQAQLYVGKEFYAQVNSSVIIDTQDNLYYFVQNGKTRTLYKNKTPLYSYKGYYGIVSDVDSKGRVYFVANSQLGSTLFVVDAKNVKRASQADNIIEARLVNDDEVLIAAVSDKDYYYVKNKLLNREEAPFETILFFEDKEYYGGKSDSNTSSKVNLDLSDPYYSVLDMHYSGMDVSLAFGDDVSTWNINARFGDPLAQNSGNFFLNKDESSTTVAGVSYKNSQYLLQYTIFAYGVISSDEKEKNRENGFIVSTELPFYKSGYYSGILSGNYYQDYNTQKREPLSVLLNFSRAEAYNYSMYENYLNDISFYGAKERIDTLYGANYNFKHSLAYEFYIGLGAKFSQTNSDISDTQAFIENRGVKISNVSYQLDMDPTTVLVPSLDASGYLKTASYAELSLAKVINFSSYWFTFPLSLQRESLYTKYRYYDLESFSNKKNNFSEITAGLTVSMVVLNKFVLPINFEYIHNDADFLEDKNKFRFMLGGTF
ncbi:hypothetical protein KKG72_10000 [bacterium]|nr:hypothetical protein [bacterium]MBU1995351.1 hypothetical protein [bacterium]